MVHNVALEKLDANMDEATIGAWRVAEGEPIEVDQPLVELITDKVTFDWNCPVSGTVRRLTAAPGSVLPIGYVLAQIGDPAGELPAIDDSNRALLEEHRRKQEVKIETGGEGPERLPREPKSRKVRATPAARRLARQHDLELADISTADGGILSEDDVRAYLASRP